MSYGALRPHRLGVSNKYLLAVAKGHQPRGEYHTHVNTNLDREIANTSFKYKPAKATTKKYLPAVAKVTSPEANITHTSTTSSDSI